MLTAEGAEYLKYMDRSNKGKVHINLLRWLTSPPSVKEAKCHIIWKLGQMHRMIVDGYKAWKNVKIDCLQEFLMEEESITIIFYMLVTIFN